MSKFPFTNETFALPHNNLVGLLNADLYSKPVLITPSAKNFPVEK